MKIRKVIKVLLIIYTIINIVVLIHTIINMCFTGNFNWDIILLIIIFYIMGLTMIFIIGMIPTLGKGQGMGIGIGGMKKFDEYYKMNGGPPEPWLLEDDYNSEQAYEEIRIHNRIAKYKGNKKRYTSIIKLIDEINEYNRLYFPYSEIKLIGIKSKEELIEDKKYSVKITKRSNEYIGTVKITLDEVR